MEIIKKEQSFSTMLVELQNLTKLCEALLSTPHYKKMGAEGVFSVASAAKSLGMDVFEALNGGLYYVNGKVGMSTETMISRMRQAGHSLTKDPKSSKTCCILHGKRGDTGDTWTTSFSLDDAKRAGIYNEKTPWGKYPDIMCYNRAASQMYRQLCPDLSRGAGYTKDELEEIPPKDEHKTTICIEELPKDELVQQRKLISQEQAQILTEIFSECDPSYVAKVWASLNKKPLEIMTISELPEDLFDRIKNAASLNVEEYKSQKKNMDEMTEEEYEKIKEA